MFATFHLFIAPFSDRSEKTCCPGTWKKSFYPHLLFSLYPLRHSTESSFTEKKASEIPEHPPFVIRPLTGKRPKQWHILERRSMPVLTSDKIAPPPEKRKETHPSVRAENQEQQVGTPEISPPLSPTPASSLLFYFCAHSGCGGLCVCMAWRSVCIAPWTPAGILTLGSEPPPSRLRRQREKKRTHTESRRVAPFFVFRCVFHFLSLRLPRSRSTAPVAITRVCLRIAAHGETPSCLKAHDQEEEEEEEGAGRDEFLLTSNQSEPSLRLTKTAGPGRASLPHTSFEALAEDWCVLRLHSAVWCRSSLLFLSCVCANFSDCRFASPSTAPINVQLNTRRNLMPYFHCMQPNRPVWTHLSVFH